MMRNIGLRHGAASLLLLVTIGILSACGTDLQQAKPQSASACAGYTTCTQCISGTQCGWCDQACVPLDAPGADARLRPKACPEPKTWTANCQ
jgi:hypothetical protein